MRRHAIIFLVAIFLPSLALGWLALRAAGKQRILIERQAADLHQAETDVLASGLRDAVDAKQREFAESVRALVAGHGAPALAENYGPLLASVWKDGGMPFAIAQRGSLVAPDRLRVDFGHPKPITPEELSRIEDLANDVVLENDEVKTAYLGM